MQNILFIANALETFNLKTDSTYLLLVTAQEMGYNVYCCQACDISYSNNQVYAQANLISIDNSRNDQNWFKVINSTSLDLNYFSAGVHVRTDPPVDLEYLNLTQLLSIAEKQGVKVYNNSSSLRNFNEKLAILNFSHLCTPTMISKNKTAILDFINLHNSCVIKPLNQMAGRGVFKIDKNDINLLAIIEITTKYYNETVMIQKFIPDVVNGDRRVFIIHGKVMEYCVCRVPQSGQIRSNLAAGGSGKAVTLTEDNYRIANEVAIWLQQQKIIFAGLDIIGSYLNEINITSPTGLPLINREVGVNLAKIILGTK
ncbi:MAG: glutathione synthase [Pseudomonadota bacterium]|jgi:glutathione synthase|nr:glutathione synthase [Burkholderiales bacterium]